MNNNNKGKSLKELYNEILAPKYEAMAAAREFVAKLAEVTKKSENTIRIYLCGSSMPDALTQSVMAEYLGTTPEDLFPKAERHEDRDPYPEE